MPTKKITALTEYTDAVAADDVMLIVDDSDTTDATSGTTKKIKRHNAIRELDYTLTGTTPAFDASNGSRQTWVLTANSTPTDSLVNGDAISLFIDDGSGYTITWPTMQWKGGVAPTLATTGYSRVELEKLAGVLYGTGVGDYS